MRRRREAGGPEPPPQPPPGLPLPEFRYHPDPRATGVIVASEARCVACSRTRGFIYTGPVYAEQEFIDAFCPWCIADGTAARRFDAEFTDVGFGVPDDVPGTVAEEVAQRTPGFSGWQQEHWLYHCGDAAAFLGRAGRDEVEAHPDALELLRREHDEDGWSSERVEEYLARLDREEGPTAYLFRCLHCGTHLAYSDFT